MGFTCVHLIQTNYTMPWVCNHPTRALVQFQSLRNTKSGQLNTGSMDGDLQGAGMLSLDVPNLEAK